MPRLKVICFLKISVTKIIKSANRLGEVKNVCVILCRIYSWNYTVNFIRISQVLQEVQQKKHFWQNDKHKITQTFFTSQDIN